MDVKCNRAALSEAVQLASSIVPNRTPKPILQCAKIEADQQDKKLTVTATDNEITIKYVVPQVQISTAGSAVLPAERIAAILRENSDETVDLRTSDATCEVIGQDSKYHIYGHDPDDFPDIPSLNVEPALVVTAEVLKRLIHLSVFSAARETSRYAINGVLWEQQSKKLCLVATDGRRLAKVDGNVTPGNTPLEQAAIVPVKTMALLERILADPQEKVQIAFTDNQISIKTTLVELVGNLVQGRFPRYSDVIPTGANKKAQIEAEPLLSAVRRAALLTNEQSKGIRLAFGDNQLCISSSTPEAGDAEVTMKVQYDAEPLDIGFNPNYLIDMLRVIGQPEIVCEFIDKTKPGLFRAGKDFLYVIMPVTG